MTEAATTPGQDAERCPWCGSLRVLVWVHGHGQCSFCGINIEPCCSGSPSPETKSSNGAPASNPAEKATQ